MKKLDEKETNIEENEVTEDKEYGISNKSALLFIIMCFICITLVTIILVFGK